MQTGLSALTRQSAFRPHGFGEQGSVTRITLKKYNFYVRSFLVRFNYKALDEYKDTVLLGRWVRNNSPGNWSLLSALEEWITSITTGAYIIKKIALFYAENAYKHDAQSLSCYLHLQTALWLTLSHSEFTPQGEG